jgi:hypothetical protein
VTSGISCGEQGMTLGATLCENRVTGPFVYGQHMRLFPSLLLHALRACAANRSIGQADRHAYTRYNFESKYKRASLADLVLGCYLGRLNNYWTGGMLENQHFLRGLSS